MFLDADIRGFDVLLYQLNFLPMPTEIRDLPTILMPLIFLCSIELICLICWLKIVMILHVSFCTTCRK